MEALSTIVRALDDFFGIADSGADPAFARFLPAVYEAHPIPWRAWAEPAFATRFNGLMIRGADRVNSVFLAAFPSDFVLRQFLGRATPGDLLFVHHPIDLESGDPHGSWGRFFQAIPAEILRDIQDAQLSIYACHAPLDYHPGLSTSRSIALALGATVTGEFFPYGKGHAGVLAEIAPTSVSELKEVLRRIFEVPYLDTAGAHPPVIRTVAVVAGAGDRVEQMTIAESKGAHAYITGEIHSRIDTDYGRAKFGEVERFAAHTRMTLLGVSHAASKFLVMKTDMRDWFQTRWLLGTALLPEAHWWR